MGVFEAITLFCLGLFTRISLLEAPVISCLLSKALEKSGGEQPEEVCWAHGYGALGLGLFCVPHGTGWRRFALVLSKGALPKNRCSRRRTGAGFQDSANYIGSQMVEIPEPR